MTRHKHFEDLRDAMLAAMASPYLDSPGEPSKSNPLAVLDNTTTAAPVQSLLAAWAVVADVLTFYQQRIADECALSTAREDRSA